MTAAMIINEWLLVLTFSAKLPRHNYSRQAENRFYYNAEQSLSTVLFSMNCHIEVLMLNKTYNLRKIFAGAFNEPLVSLDLI